MIPYADLTYFAILAATALLVLILRWFERDVRLTILIASLAVIGAQFYSPRFTLVSFGVFAVLQCALAGGFLWACRSFALGSPWRRWSFFLVIALSLLPLIACRVLPMLPEHFPFGFLGISYVTFRSLDVLIGVNDGLIASIDAGQFLAFLFFFPPISSGPIDRYRRFGQDWTARPERSRILPDLDSAVQHFFRGLLYKFILAYLIKTYWLDPAQARPGALGMASYMYAYSAYLFFDFAGYSAFAVGASYLFGIHTPENFNRPFLAPNIRDFWTRWHISLSTWFRDHVYMRFVMLAMKRKWFANPRHASYAAYTVTFGLMGLWHGFASNFLIYGLYHAGLLIGYDRFSVWNKKRQLLRSGPWSRGFATFVTANAVCFGFLIFSGHLYSGKGAEKPSLKGGLHAANQLKGGKGKKLRAGKSGSLTEKMSSPPARRTAVA